MAPFYQAITDFIFVEDEPETADVIFVPGGNYPEAARYAAQLYLQGYAPLVLPSGRYSITAGRFKVSADAAGRMAGENVELRRGSAVQDGEAVPDEATEAVSMEFSTEFAYLRSILLSCGVPEGAILKEDRAEYTYQNAIYSRERLEALNIHPEKAILCCQAFHARRCLLYYQEQFPRTEFLVCPVVTRGISRDNWHRTEEGIDTVLGEVERCGSQFHQILREYRNV